MFSVLKGSELFDMLTTPALLIHFGPMTIKIENDLNQPTPENNDPIWPFSERAIYWKFFSIFNISEQKSKIYFVVPNKHGIFV